MEHNGLGKGKRYLWKLETKLHQIILTLQLQLEESQVVMQWLVLDITKYILRLEQERILFLILLMELNGLVWEQLYLEIMDITYFTMELIDLLLLEVITMQLHILLMELSGLV